VPFCSFLPLFKVNLTPADAVDCSVLIKRNIPFVVLTSVHRSHKVMNIIFRLLKFPSRV
jgi:hypothetical protein